MKILACGNIWVLCITAALSATEKSSLLHPSPSIVDSRPVIVHLSIDMAFIDILSLILSFGVIFSLRFLFPRNIVPLVSTSFEEAGALLEQAETINIPYASEHRANLAMYACFNSTLAVSLPKLT